MNRIVLSVVLFTVLLGVAVGVRLYEGRSRDDGRLVRDMVAVMDAGKLPVPPKTVPQGVDASAGEFRRQDGSYLMTGKSQDGGHEALPDKWSSPGEVLRMEFLGRAVFAAHCVSCHGAMGAGDGKSASAAGMPAIAPLQDRKYKSFYLGRFYRSIADGQGNMPSFARRLTVEEMWAAALWSRHLRDLPAGEEADHE